MAISILDFKFEGPFKSTGSLKDNSGVYAILCKKDDGDYSLVDVGESATVKSRVDNHDRKACWNGSCHSSLEVAVHYTPGLQQAGRMVIEQKIRKRINPPCGDR